MQSLPCPPRNQVRNQLSIALVVYGVAGEGGYPATEADLDNIIALYDIYDGSSGTPVDNLKGGGLAPALKQAIFDGYDFTQQGRKLYSIRTDLMRGVERCPICGISPPRELDHYLPRSSFSALSIYVRNLVPVCHDCNHSKGATFPTDSAQAFLHPYFQALPALPFLQATVSIEDSALLVKYSVDPNSTLPEQIKQRAAHQLSRLKLNERYAREINAYLVSHTTALHMCFQTSGAVGVEDFLSDQANVEASMFHINHWRPLLLRALAAHPEFCAGGFSLVLP